MVCYLNQSKYLNLEMIRKSLIQLFMRTNTLFSCRRLLRISTVMPKKTVVSNIQAMPSEEDRKTKPVNLNKDGSIIINVHAKPGALQNAVTDFSSEGIGIQIAAPPKEGEANAELVCYITKVLGLRKSSVSLQRGSKSRIKAVRVESDSLTAEKVMELLLAESSNR